MTRAPITSGALLILLASLNALGCGKSVTAVLPATELDAKPSPVTEREPAPDVRQPAWTARAAGRGQVLGQGLAGSHRARSRPTS